MRGIDLGSVARDAVVAHNVVYANLGYGLSLESGSTNAQVRNNITWNNGENNYLDRGVNTSQSHNLIGVDPRFVNADAFDPWIQAGSPAVDAGTPLTLVTTDFDGASRLQHGGFDIGAFEWR